MSSCHRPSHVAMPCFAHAMGPSTSMEARGRTSKGTKKTRGTSTWTWKRKEGLDGAHTTHGKVRTHLQRRVRVCAMAPAPSEHMRVRLPDRVVLGIATTRVDGERLAQKLRTRLDEPPDVPGARPETLEARAALLQAAARSLYRYAGERMPAEDDTVVNMPMAMVPGALLLLLEAGRCDDAIAAGKAFLQMRTKPYPGATKDATVVVALALCELGREALEANPPSAVEARARFRDAKRLLSSGPQALRKDVEEVLDAIEADATVEVLARAASETKRSIGRPVDATLKSQALTAVENFLFGKGFQGNAKRAEKFFRNVSKYLSSREMVAVFERSGGGRKANPALVYEVALAMIAQAWETRTAARLEDAERLLAKLARDAVGGAQDVHLERAMCSLLLGQPNQAQEHILQPGVDPDVLAFVRKNSRGAADLLPGLCVLAESWMDEVLFPRFRDTSNQYADLNQWFGDKGVALYLEWLDERNNSPLRKVLHKVQSTIAFAVTPKPAMGTMLTDPASGGTLATKDGSDMGLANDEGYDMERLFEGEGTEASEWETTSKDALLEVGTEADVDTPEPTVAPNIEEQVPAEVAEGEPGTQEPNLFRGNQENPDSEGSMDESSREERKTSPGLILGKLPALLEEQMDRDSRERPVIDSFVKTSTSARNTEAGASTTFSSAEVEEVLEILQGIPQEGGVHSSTILPGYRGRRKDGKTSWGSRLGTFASILLAALSLGMSGSVLGLGAAGRLKPEEVKKHISTKIMILRAEKLSLSPTPGAKALPDTSKAAGKKGSLFPLSKNTAAMNKQLAEKILREWQRVKSLALGGDHEVQLLENVLIGPMLSQWRQRAAEVKSHSWYWEYALVSLSVEKCITNKEGDKAVVEATIQEAAQLHDPRDPHNGDSYKSTYCAQYELVRGPEGGVDGWKIVGGRVLY